MADSSKIHIRPGPGMRGFRCMHSFVCRLVPARAQVHDVGMVGSLRWRDLKLSGAGGKTWKQDTATTLAGGR